MKRILIINGHPDSESYNYALAKAYQEGAIEAGAKPEVLNLAELQFDPNLRFGYRKRSPWEPDLEAAMEKIQQADHLVWVFPLWWYGLPAMMKGFIDRTFLPGITFQPIPGKPLPKKLMKGKTARIIVTADTPGWYHRLFMHRPVIHQFKQGTLEFCGIKPVKVTYIAMIKDSTDQFRAKWLSKVKAIGAKLG